MEVTDFTIISSDPPSHEKIKAGGHCVGWWSVLIIKGVENCCYMVGQGKYVWNPGTIIS